MQTTQAHQHEVTKLASEEPPTPSSTDRVPQPTLPVWLHTVSHCFLAVTRTAQHHPQCCCWSAHSSAPKTLPPKTPALAPHTTAATSLPPHHGRSMPSTSSSNSSFLPLIMLLASSRTYSGVVSTTTAMVPLASSIARSLAKPPTLSVLTGWVGGRGGGGEGRGREGSVAVEQGGEEGRLWTCIQAVSSACTAGTRRQQKVHARDTATADTHCCRS